MRLKLSPNGNIYIRDGRLLFGSEGECCCNDTADPICCYNDNCQVVSCGDPSVIGSVPDCDLCNLNFCGFCQSTEPTSQPVDQVENYPYPQQVTTYDLCRFVEPDMLESEIDASGTLRILGGDSRFLAVSRHPNGSSATSRITVNLDTLAGFPRLRYTIDGAARVGTGGAGSNVVLGIANQLLVNQLQDGATWEGRNKTTLLNVVITRVDTENCTFNIEADYEFEYELTITNPDSSVPLNITDTQTGSLNGTYSSVPCDPGNFNTTLQADLIAAGATPSIIDTNSFSRAFATQKPFTPFGPTCESPN